MKLKTGTSHAQCSARLLPKRGVCCHRRFHSIVAIAALFLINWRSRPTATRNRFIAMNFPLTRPLPRPLLLSFISLTRSCFGPSSVSSIPIMFHFLPLSFFMPHTQCALSVSSAVDSHLSSSSSSCDNAAGVAVAVAVVVAFVSHVKNTPSEFGMCHNSSARGVATSSGGLTFCRTRTRVWG